MKIDRDFFCFHELILMSIWECEETCRDGLPGVYAWSSSQREGKRGPLMSSRTAFRSIILGGVYAAMCSTAIADDAGHSRFAPQAAADALLDICSSEGFHVDVGSQMLGAPNVQAQSKLQWALAADAKVWDLDSRDGEVLLYAFGQDASQCGVIINHAVPQGGRFAVTSELVREGGFEIQTQSQISAGVEFVRLFNKETGRYVDIVDYPGSARSPGLLKVELLAN